MKAISLTQPWATLVAIGAKRIETRSWSTRYRGPLAIHAAKGFPVTCQDLIGQMPFSAALLPRFRDGFKGVVTALPRGSVIALARLIDCRRIVTREYIHADAGASSAYRANSEMFPPAEEPELSFGDYTHGRFAWILDDVVALAEPIPAKGALGLWEWRPAADKG